MNEYIWTQQAECRDCYRCLRNCPVKSISFVTKQAKIDPDRCILCGQCVVECPQKAKVYQNQTDQVLKMLQEDRPVVLSLAPSYLASFEQAPHSLFEAICQAGFADVEETAAGAALTTREYRRLLRTPEWQGKTGLSTCCPVIVSLVEKYYPKLRQNLLPVLSPMAAHSRLIRSRLGENSRVVFAGPCIAKLEEAQRFGLDAALTFGQLKVLLLSQAHKGSVSEKSVKSEFAHRGQWIPTRSYPIHNGVLYSVKGSWGSDQDYWSIEGMDQCMEVLNALENGDIDPAFIEMMACVGGCVGGPAIDSKDTLYKRKQIIQDTIKASQGWPLAIIPESPGPMGKDFHDQAVADERYTEEQIQEVLRKMGKNSPEDERNCEGCGYSSCRAKAIGVLSGLATIEMCIPAMRAKAESLAHTVMDNTPNAVLVLDEGMAVRDFNPSAQALFSQIPFAVGMDLSGYLNVEPYNRACRSKTNSYGCCIEYPQWELVTRQTLVPIPAERLLLLIIEDVTEMEQERREMDAMKTNVMEKAKKVIHQQMTVAQTIASLLGETTADTKATLYELLKHLEGGTP